VNFSAYFNQLTPENAGKWGSVEAVRDVMVWDGLDTAYAFAKEHGLSFKLHVLVLGNQQPAWIEALPPAEQREEIEEWFTEVAHRYPALDYIEVVNEPLHDPPTKPGDGGGNYAAALGGDGKTGWDWVLESFRLARRHFPGSKLMLNDFSILDQPADALRYKAIIQLLQEERLIDAIGVQGHGFSTRGPLDVMRESLDLLASTQLPIFVTELDIDGVEDAEQLSEYQRVFPLLWEHPAVRGVTLWGYRPGMWRTAQGAYLALENGAERPALVWLRGYVKGSHAKQ
jgi:endo-1,4-beta-xylanase